MNRINDLSCRLFSDTPCNLIPNSIASSVYTIRYVHAIVYRHTHKSKGNVFSRLSHPAKYLAEQNSVSPLQALRKLPSFLSRPHVARTSTCHAQSKKCDGVSMASHLYLAVGERARLRGRVGISKLSHSEINFLHQRKNPKRLRPPTRRYLRFIPPQGDLKDVV